MKQTTKNILGVAAIVLLSSGVAGLTAYKMLQKNTPADSTAAFSDMFQQNPNVRLASYNAVDAQPVDLTQAAENSVHAVVHIRSTQASKVQEVEVRDRSLISSVNFLVVGVVHKDDRFRLLNVQVLVPVLSSLKTDIS